MRVVAGEAGGRKLLAPAGDGTRPTSDRVREAVFNSLASAAVVVGADVLDLFAGSGAMGIEALSRGARHVWFVESDADACDVIARNLATVGFTDRASIVRAQLPAAVDGLDVVADLVFADPPYAFDAWDRLLASVRAVVSPVAWGVLESDRSVAVGDGWEKVRERAYGGTVITYVSVTDTGHRHKTDNATGVDP